MCAGIVANGAAKATIKLSTVRYASDGLVISGVTSPLVSGNIVKDSLAAHGISLQNVSGGTVSDNVVTRSAGSGLRVSGSSSGISLSGNDARTNGGTDCVDVSTGPNTWTGNLGLESNPGGLCAAS